MNEHDEPVPQWLLERLAAGDLPAENAAALRARLERSGGRERLAEIEAANARALLEHPPAAVAAEVQNRRIERERAARQRWRSHSRLPIAAAALGVAAVVLLWRQPPDPAPSGPESIAARGLRPHLVVYKNSAVGPRVLAAGSRVRAFETLQLAYVAADQRYGVIASLDARGTVTLHLPETAGTSARLIRERETALPHAFELDDTPGFEHFVFVTAQVPFSTQLLTDALRPGGPTLPSWLSVYEVRVEKESP